MALLCASAACGTSSSKAPPAAPDADAGSDAAPATCTSGQYLDAATQQCVSCDQDMRLNAAGTACVKVGWQSCPAGFVVDPTGYGCMDVSPPGDCPAGKMPTIGSAACQPVGVTSCAAGFSPDPSGWGCAAVAPPAACSGPTMEKLGSAACVAVGDCTAAFPPPAATLFVSATGPSDATHFTTIGAALAASSDGVTIAVDSGTYPESLALLHAVNVIGRCPAQVTIAASTPAAAGVIVSGVHGATVSGVTVHGKSPGVAVSAGASLTLSAVVIDGNLGAGVSVSGNSSSVTIEDSVVRGTTATAAAIGDGVDLSSGASATLERSAVVGNTQDGLFATGAATMLSVTDSIVSDNVQNATANGGDGIQVVMSAAAEVDGSYIARNQEAGIDLTSGSQVHVTQSVIANTAPSMVAGYGRGMTVDGAHAIVDESSIVQNVDLGVATLSPGGVLDATNSVFRAQTPNTDGTHGAGVSATAGAAVNLTGVALVGNTEEGALVDGAGSVLTMNASIARDGVMLAGDTAGDGAAAQNGGALVLQGSALIANHESALIMFDPQTTAKLTLSILAYQLPSQGGQFGRGIILQNGPALTMSQSVIANNTDIGLSSTGAGTNATLTESVIRDTDPQVVDGAHGRALNIVEQSTATVSLCELYDNTEVAALVSGSSAQLTIDSSVIAATRLDKVEQSAGRGFAAQLTGIGSITGSAVLDNFQVGVSSMATGATLTVATTLIDGTKPSADGTYGHGILVDDAATLTAANSTVRNSAAVGAVVAAATATFADCRILNNAVGINVQGGSALNQVAVVPASPQPLDVDVSTDTVFDGNQTKVSANVLPLPPNLN